MNKFSMGYLKFIIVLFLCADLSFYVFPLFPLYFSLLHIDLITLAVSAVILIVNIVNSAVKKSWDKEFYVFYIIGTLGSAFLYGRILYQVVRSV